MGHRKKSAPRRGSLAFRPRARAASIVPSVRDWPDIVSEKPTLLGFVGYKAGLTQIITIDDREKTPYFGKPIFNASTIISTPPILICGIRAYGRNDRGLFVMKDVYAQLPDELGIKTNREGVDKALKAIEASLDEVVELSALVSTSPREGGLSQKEPYLIEVKVGGGEVKARFEYLKSLMGKKMRVQDVVKPGSHLDVIAISKGKGFEGPVTRFGVKRKQHKSRKSVRAVAVLGPWHPTAVTYTVPRAGQRGYYQRVEYNKKVIIVGNGEEQNITPKGGFPHFGIVKGDYVVLRGSVPGPAKRMVKLRYPMRGPKAKPLPPKVVEVRVK